MGRGFRPLALLQDQPPGAVERRGQAHRQCAGGGRRPLHRSRRDGAGGQIRPARHHRRARGPRSPIPGCRARSTRAASRTSANASAAISASRASISAARSSAPRTRRRWRNTAAAGIPSASTSRSAPRPALVVGAGPAGPGMRPRAGPARLSRSSLVEAETTLGGHLRDVVRLPGLAEWGRVITYREGQLEPHGQCRRSCAAPAW